MTTLSPREIRHRQTYNAILDAARHIIKEKGTDKLSMRAIAKAINYSPAGLYEYFGSKEEIIDGVCKEGHLTLKRYMERVDTSLPPADYMVEIGMAYIEFARQNPDYFLLIFSGSAADMEMEQMIDEGSAFPLLLAGIQRGVDADLFRQTAEFDVMGLAYMAWSVVHGQAMLQLTFLKNGSLPFEHLSRQALERTTRAMMS